VVKTIKLSDEAHEALRKLGVKGETFEKIIVRLIDRWRETERR